MSHIEGFLAWEINTSHLDMICRKKDKAFEHLKDLWSILKHFLKNQCLSDHVIFFICQNKL